MTYPDGKKAIRNLNLSIKPGIFGLLGPNGAGKSTLMEVVAGVNQNYVGEVLVDGEPLNPEQRLTGYLPQNIGFYPDLSVYETLNYFSKLKNLKPKKNRIEWVDFLLDKTNLWARKNQKVSTLSGGMVRRLGLAQALLGNPEILIIDEPTVGLDPKEKFCIFEYLYELSGTKLVIFSSHEVQDISDISSSFGILNEGEIIYSGSPLQAIGSLEGLVWKIPAQEYKPSDSSMRFLTNKLINGKLFSIVTCNNRPPIAQAIEPTLESFYLNKMVSTNVEY